jgi:hypothetical protein
LKRREGAAPERILLSVDQGEELYTRAAQTDAKRFSEVLAKGLGDSRLCAFGSLRADYFDRLQADEPLFKCHEHVSVPPLDRAQLHEVVTAPAHRRAAHRPCGRRVERGVQPRRQAHRHRVR